MPQRCSHDIRHTVWNTSTTRTVMSYLDESKYAHVATLSMRNTTSIQSAFGTCDFDTQIPSFLAEKRSCKNVNSVTFVAGFFNLVVYTQRRVPDTEIKHGYQEEITQESF